MKILILTLAVLVSTAGESRPQYAARHGVNRCTACHVSPVGGGPRNLYGKLYGSRFNSRPAKYSTQETISLETYGNYYLPEKAKETPGGFGIMALNVSGFLPLVEESQRAHLLVNQNIGGFPGGAGGPRDAYLRFSFYEGAAQMKPQHFLLGRFHAPFGIISDEHRTYTRLQNKTTWNDLEAGALVSGNIGENLHYDIAGVNGQKTGGTNFVPGNAHLWGAIINVRKSLPKLKSFVGVSGSYHRSDQGNPDPWATSVYGTFTQNRWDLTLEYTEAENWNSALTGFVANAGYLQSVSYTRSRGYFAQFNFYQTRRLAWVYKFDDLMPDVKYPADYYQRHGVGLRYQWLSNVYFRVRYEWAAATHPTEENKTSKGAQDAAWLVFNIWI